MAVAAPEESALQQLLVAGGLQDKLVVQNSQPNLNFAVGQISLLDGSLASIALIAHVEDRFLVAVPSPLWHRKATNRKLIAGALSKPIHCAVACCRDDDRPTRLVDSSIKVWIAFLSDPAEKLVSFQDGAELAFPFTADDEEDVVPFAPALLEVSQEKFIFLSAESGGGEDPPEAAQLLPPAEERIGRLEEAMSEIQASLQQLISVTAGPRGDGAPKASTAAASSKAKPKAAAKVSFSGLDQTVVDSALAAGVPAEHLTEVAGILKKRPGKLEDLPRKPGTQVPNELSESEDEDLEEAEELAVTSGSGSGSGESGVAKAIVKLTKVCSALARQKTARKESLEALLDSSGLVSGEGSGSVGSSKCNAAALRALKQCLQSNPEFLFKSIEANLLMDFESRSVRPGSPMGSATVRGWLEARSRIQNYTAHVRWAWQVGGIWDGYSGSTSEMRSFGVGGRPSRGGWWLLGFGKCDADGGTSSIPSFCQPSTTYIPGSSTYCTCRPEVDRVATVSCERHGELSRGKETFGKTDKDRTSYGSREAYSKGQAEGEVSKRKQGSWERRSTCSRGGCGVNASSFLVGGRDAETSTQFSSRVEDTAQPSCAVRQEFKVPRVPGPAASVYVGRKLFNAAPRYLLNSSSGLGMFARSSFGFPERDGSSTERSSGGFPIPLPYPEIVKSTWKADPIEVSRKKMLSAVLVGLNYLHLNRPTRAPANIRLGQPLSRAQWGIVRRLELFLDAWLSHNEVGPTDMGRTAPKVGCIEEMIVSLTDQARRLTATASPSYFPAGREDVVAGSGGLKSGVVVGQLEHSAYSTVKPVEPDRLKFIGRPTFNPLPFLDSRSAFVYKYPLQAATDPDDFGGQIPFVQVHCSKDTKLKLFSLLDQSGRLALHPASTVRPRFASGLFSVLKDEKKDRLIMDSRPSNCLEEVEQRWVRSLAVGESLCRLTLKDSDVLRTSSNDLRDYYYLFQITEERSRRNILWFNRCGRCQKLQLLSQ